MPAILANQRRMLSTTDFPDDKVIFLGTGEVTCGALGSGSQLQTISIPHTLGFPPLPLGTWTTDASWDVSYEMDSGPVGPNPGTSTFSQDVSVSASSTEISVRVLNYTAAPATIYVRVYALCPSDQDPEVAETASVSNEFQRNSDLNYTKLFAAGVFDQPSFGGSTSYPVTHALGYRPQVQTWIEQLGVTSPLTDTTPGISSFAPRVTTSDVVFDMSFPPATRLHWRVYLDSQT